MILDILPQHCGYVFHIFWKISSIYPMIYLIEIDFFFNCYISITNDYVHFMQYLKFPPIVQTI